jgi:hypothetical protein
MALDVAAPLADRSIILGVEPCCGLHGSGDARRDDGGEDRLPDGLVDLHAADVQTIDSAAIDDVLAGAVVAG